MQKTCIVIAGPTAVGKTSLAIELAQHFSTEIISADSRQCYRELNIAVAKPTQTELSLVPHHFINSHSIRDNISAADFEQFALQHISSVFKNNDLAVIVGGTGLYIKAFCEGLDAIPAVDEAVRKDIAANYDQHGIAWLREQLQTEDPVYFAQGEILNPQRMKRALEVKLSSGESITSYQKSKIKERPFRIIKIGLEMPKAMLYDRINARVDRMVAEGLEEEARQLVMFRNLNALQTVGYRELFSFFDGKLSRDEAIALLKQNSRHYAKRQLTWFKKDSQVQWLNATSPSLIEDISNIVEGK